MNSYKFTFRYPESSEETAYITERTEAAARKALVKRFGKDAEVLDVELHDTSVPATKEQERETLEKIKSMVADLGPQSYLAAAFQGVFEDAEQNIEDDAAYSWRDRAECAGQRVKLLEGRIRELVVKCDGLDQTCDEHKATIERLEGEKDELRKRLLPVWLHSALHALATEDATAARQRMEESAETMAQLADAPQDIGFAAAVKSYRAAKERREVCEQIIAGLEPLTE